ncbi:MAG: insulinase family protein [Solobacterium sp.]|nr:insulinase family protein [Solobacterium sp.]
MKPYELCSGVNLHVIDGTKFKTHAIHVNLLWSMDQSKWAASFLLSYLLADTTFHYPTKKQLLEQQDRLYGASLNVLNTPRGACDSLRFSLSEIHSLEEGEDLLEAGFELVGELLFYARLEDGVFPEAMFMECREQAILSVRMAMDDPATECAEAAIRAYGGAAGMRALPTVEELESLTSSQCAEVWEFIRRNARVDIQVLSCESTERIVELTRRYFPFEARVKQGAVICPYQSSELRVETSRDLPQTHLTMLFETGVRLNDSRYPALVLANGLFGGLPSSLLFREVREAQGLCYSIDSALLSMDGLIRVMTAVEAEHLEETITSITEQAEAIRNGSFEEEDLEMTKQMIINVYRASLDDPDSLLSYNYRQALIWEVQSIEELCKTLGTITKQELCDSIASLRLTTISILHQNKEGE